MADARQPASDDEVRIPALEVRLPADSLLVVDAPDGSADWMVVRASDDLGTVEELEERHRSFLDAVEYVARVAEQVADDLPVVDLDLDGIEAVAVYDAEGGVYAVVKEGDAEYGFLWVDDDGDVERVATYGTLKEALLLPVLDQELFGVMDEEPEPDEG